MGSKIPKENMIPLGNDEEHDAKVRAKLKGTASDKRKFAQSLRRAKENPEKTGTDIHKLISDSSASAKQIQEMIQIASKMDLKPNEFIQLIRTTIAKHSAIFGSKTDIKLDANVKLDAYIKQRNQRNISTRLIVWKTIEVREKEWKEKFGTKQAGAMIEVIKEFGEGFEDNINRTYENVFKIAKGEEVEEFGSHKHLLRIKEELEEEKKEKEGE